MIKGITEARIFTDPKRELTQDTSLGFACIDYAREILKVNLYPWQEWVLIHLLEIEGELESSWHFRYRTAVIMVARQNGKTLLSAVLASFFMNVLQVDNIFGTSLSMDKAEETWEAVISLQEGSKELSTEIDTVARRNGGKKLVLKGKREYKVGAPTRRAGRGDSNDLVLLDELREHRDWETWSAAVASTNAKPNGMVVCFSNAGDPDSVVLRQLRSSVVGIDADFGGNVDTESLGWFEWSADDKASINDLEQLAKANPALGYGKLTERALLSNASTFPENKFRSECMCQQVETILPQPFPDGAWENALDEKSQIAAESEIYFGIDMSHNRKWTTIAACGLREDGNYHIEIVARAVGSEWAIDWFRSRCRSREMKLAYQGRGATVSGLAEQICTMDGMFKCNIEGPELTQGWGRFWEAVAAQTPDENRGGVKVFHLDQPVLNRPAMTYQLRIIGVGIELPDRVKSPDDIAPLMACAMAFSACTSIHQKQEKKIYQSAYVAGSKLTFI